MTEITQPQSTAMPPREAPQPKEAPSLKGRYTWGTGRRKTATARVRVRDGSGTFRINSREIDAYFSETKDRKAVIAPLELVDQLGGYDVFVNVKGGGYTGQAEAVRLGVARALAKILPQKEPQLREAGYLTRDSRMVERKKYGHRGARRSFQFSKR